MRLTRAMNQWCTWLCYWVCKSEIRHQLESKLRGKQSLHTNGVAAGVACNNSLLPDDWSADRRFTLWVHRAVNCVEWHEQDRSTTHIRIMSKGDKLGGTRWFNYTHTYHEQGGQARGTLLNKDRTRRELWPGPQSCTWVWHACGLPYNTKMLRTYDGFLLS